MTRGATGRAVALGLLVIAAAIFVATELHVTTDLTQFMPDSADRRLAEISRSVVDSELSRTMILGIEAPSTGSAVAASRHFETSLLADRRIRETVEFLEGGPGAGIAEATWELFAPRRLSYLAATPEEARERLSDVGLAEAANDLRNRLASPLSSLVARLAPDDPLLVLPGLLDRTRFARSSDLSIVDDRFVAADGRTAILFLGTKISALDAGRQRPVLDAIRDAFAETQSDSPVDLVLHQSGVNRYATRTADTIEADIRRVSISSSIVLAIGLFLLFRSLRILPLAAIPVTVGLVMGTCAVLATRGTIHGITLAFGAALISVTIDYAVHLYCHQVLVRPVGGPTGSTRALILPLATGCTTTLAGFVAISSSPLDGLQEIGLFGLVGVASAFVATFVGVPIALPATADLPDRSRWNRAILNLFAGLRRNRLAVSVVPLAVVLVVALGLPKVEWQPDVTRLSGMDADIRAEDEALRAKISRFEQMRMVVAWGDDEETALRRNEDVAAAMAAAVDAGELADFRSLMPLLPSAATQRAVSDVAREDETLAMRWERAFRGAGFRTEQFSGFVDHLGADTPPPLDFDTLLSSPLGPLIRSFRIHFDDKIGFVTLLGSVHDGAAVATRLEDVDDAMLLEQSSLMRSTQAAVQRSTGRVLVWGAVAVLAILVLRYRELRCVAASLAPPLLAVATTIATLALLGRGIDLVALTALVFVVSMGVDYSVLLVDAGREHHDGAIAAALTGALVACGTTCMAFGLLSQSAHPVLSNLGLTVMIGVATSFLLAPITLVLVERRPEPEARS